MVPFITVCVILYTYTTALHVPNLIVVFAGITGGLGMPIVHATVLIIIMKRRQATKNQVSAVSYTTALFHAWSVQCYYSHFKLR